MRLKEALAKAGKIDPSQVTRGRPSAQMIEWGKELVKDGWSIEGFQVPASAVSDKPAEVKHTPATNTGKDISDIGDPIHPLHSWRAVITVNGKKVPPPTGPKAVCNTCIRSLPWCFCETPIVNLDHERTAVVEWVIRTN